MIRKTTISIPVPCHENWEAMTPTDQGRFCDSCQKNVIDFTRETDREILAELNSGGKLCGRFLPSQLEREIVTPKEKSPLWIAASALAFLGLGQNAYSQDKPSMVQTDKKVAEQKLIEQQIAAEQGNQVVHGTVSDDAGTLPGANVVVKGSNRSVQTDIDGKYSISVREDQTLVFSFVGFEVQEREVSGNKKIDVTLKESGRLVGEIVVVKRTHAGRVFHKMGNWFRRPGHKRY